MSLLYKGPGVPLAATGRGGWGALGSGSAVAAAAEAGAGELPAIAPRYCTPKEALRCSKTAHCIAAAGTILKRFGTRPCTASRGWRLCRRWRPHMPHACNAHCDLEIRRTAPLACASGI